MALSDITTYQGTNGIGAPIPGEDYISGIVAYTNSLPAGFSSTERVKEIFSPEDAEALGIVGDYSDETKAAATVAITAIGTNGDIIVIKVEEWKSTITLATYTKVSGDTTISLVATAIRALINAGTITSGYTASGTGANIIITARPGVGIYLNASSKLTNVITGTITSTITDFSGGVASVLKPLHYHIKEHFRSNPSSDLFVGLFAVPGGAYDFAEVITLQNFANGKVRQVGVYYQGTFTSADVAAAQAVAVYCDVAHTPLIIGLCGNLAASSLTALTDLSASASEMIFVNIGQDGANLGNDIFKSVGKSIGSIGSQLGTISLSGVGQNIAEVGAFQLATAELDVIAFTTGELYSAQTLTGLASVENKKYTFLRKVQPGLNGTYWNYAYTCTSTASDYNTIERNRVIQKAKRVTRTGLLPKLNSKLILNQNGTLTQQTIAAYIQLIEPQLDILVASQDLSAYEVFINPAQNVLQTSNIAITLKLLPVGISKQIVVNIGYVAKLS